MCLGCLLALNFFTMTTIYSINFICHVEMTASEICEYAYNSEFNKSGLHSVWRRIHDDICIARVLFFQFIMLIGKHFYIVLYPRFTSRKHTYMILTPLRPHFLYSKTGVYRGIHYFSYFCLKHWLWNSLEPPRRGDSNEYPQSMFWAEIRKKIRIFIWKFSFFGGKIFSIFE